MLSRSRLGRVARIGDKGEGVDKGQGWSGRSNAWTLGEMSAVWACTLNRVGSHGVFLSKWGEEGTEQRGGDIVGFYLHLKAHSC